MKHQPGTKIQITEIKKRDYIWIDNEFDYISLLLNGKKGAIIEYLPASEKYDEREAYLVSIEVKDEKMKYELEEDEFTII
jgi:hypothetical protein